MNRIAALSFIIAANGAMACIPGTDLIEYIPLKREGGSIVEARDLLTPRFISLAKTALQQCMVKNGSIHLGDDGQLRISENMAEDKDCIANVTDYVQSQLKAGNPRPKVKIELTKPDV